MMFHFLSETNVQGHLKVTYNHQTIVDIRTKYCVNVRKNSENMAILS